MDLDRVEIAAVQHLDADDVSVARGDEFLDQRGRVDAEGESVLSGGRAARPCGRVEALDACAAAADIRLDDDGPAEAFGGGEGLAGAMDHARFRVGQAEVVEQRELGGLGEFGAKGLEAVDDADSAALEVFEIAEGVEDGVAVLAVPCRWAHAVDDERILIFGVVFGGVGVLDGVQLDVVRAATVEFGEEGFEPVLLFVVDREGLVVVRGHESILSRSTERRCTG